MVIYKKPTKWWEIFIRKHFKYVPEGRAAVWKQRLSVVYFLTVWNFIAYAFYKISSVSTANTKVPEQSTVEYYANMFSANKPVKVINVKGFSVQDTVIINNRMEEE